MYVSIVGKHLALEVGEARQIDHAQTQRECAVLDDLHWIARWNTGTTFLQDLGGGDGSVHPEETHNQQQRERGEATDEVENHDVPDVGRPSLHQLDGNVDGDGQNFATEGEEVHLDSQRLGALVNQVATQ